MGHFDTPPACGTRTYAHAGELVVPLPTCPPLDRVESTAAAAAVLPRVCALPMPLVLPRGS
jgi:hypothetical protein